MKYYITILFLLSISFVFAQCDNTATGSGAVVVSPSFTFEYSDTEELSVDISGENVTLTANGIERVIRLTPTIDFYNNVVDYTSTTIDGLLVHDPNNDDSSPIYINDDILGGNHGTGAVKKINAPLHGKTPEDIGAEWLDGAGVKWYIVRIETVNDLWILSENIGTPEEWDFVSTITGTTLTHSQNATNTGDINFTLVGNRQLYPSIKNHVVSTSFADVFTITEDYDIVNPASALDSIIAAVGSATAPPTNNGTIIAHINIIRTFYANGSEVVEYNFNNLVELNLNTIQAIQVSKLGSIDFTDEYIYVPNSLPVAAVDYTDITDFNTNPSIDFLQASWDGEIIRAVEYVGNGGQEYGMALGYHYDQPVITNRASLVDNAINIRNTGKIYPRAVRNQNAIPIGTTYNIIAYRNYFKVESTFPTSKYSYVVDGEKFTYIDFHSNGTYNFEPSQGYCFRDLVEARNVTYVKELGNIVLNKSGLENYGYVLIKEYN